MTPECSPPSWRCPCSPSGSTSSPTCRPRTPSPSSRSSSTCSPRAAGSASSTTSTPSSTPTAASAAAPGSGTCCAPSPASSTPTPPPASSSSRRTARSAGAPRPAALRHRRRLPVAEHGRRPGVVLRRLRGFDLSRVEWPRVASTASGLSHEQVSAAAALAAKQCILSTAPPRSRRGALLAALRERRQMLKMAP